MELISIWLLATVAALCLLCVSTYGQAAESPTFYVATDGKDAWSGRLPAPDGKGLDGPFATLARARDGRSGDQEGRRPQAGRSTSWCAGGTHFLSEPFALTAEDSGTPSARSPTARMKAKRRS